MSRRRAQLTSALATLLLPILLAGLLIAAGELLPAPGRSTAGPSSGAASSHQEVPQLPTVPAATPWPVPPHAYFATTLPAGQLVRSQAYLGAPPRAPRPPALPVLHDRAAILVDLTGRQVLYEHDGLAPLPTASLAKLVTVQVALQHVSLQTVLSVPSTATQLGADDTRMGLNAGEQLTVQELIDGVLLESANDAALVLAQAIMPEPVFIGDMNALVRSWGLSNAAFTNPTGLDAPGELASAYDLAVIAAHLVEEQPELLQISEQKQIQIPQTSSHKAYDLGSLIGPILTGFPGADGLKTGFTDDAGYCLALTDRRGGRTLLAIVLNSPRDVDDAQALITYGFSVDPP
jgi:serine-type D-Ala-D-Ala carboxypeptidase (penicillin-binding protein 5/6)